MNIYFQNETDFTHNGLGFLTDVLSSKVEDNLNGDYSLFFEYKISGHLSEYLENENIVKCKVADGSKQLFIIKNVIKTFTSIQVTCKHIFYSLLDNFLEDTAPTNLSPQPFLNWVLERTTYPNPFKVYSDISTSASARYVRRNPVDCILGDTDNSMVNLFRGELKRDNFNIHFNKQIGNDNGVKLIVGKNITGINITVDSNSVHTKIMPQGYDGLLLPEKYIDSPLINIYLNPKIYKVEFSDIKYDPEDENAYHNLEEAYEALRTATRKLFDDGIDKPSINVKVDWIELSKTNEYKDYSNLEKVNLGDTITIDLLDVSYTTRVIKTIYNPLIDRIETFELGTPKANIGTSTNNIQKQIEKLPTSILESAKSEATKMLTEAMGGYVYKTNNELFIMDTNDPNTAIKIWRWNMNGLGYSSNGIDGPYETAITSDGKIVADFISTGKLNTSVIEGYDSLVTQVSNNTSKFNDYYEKSLIDILIQTAETGVTNTFSEAGGNNIIRNSHLNYPSEEKITKKETGNPVKIEKAKQIDTLRLNGYTKQKTYSGKQLFDKTKEYDYTNVAGTLTISELDTGLKVQSSFSDGRPFISYKLIDLANYTGKIIRIKSNILNSSSNNGSYGIGLVNSDVSIRQRKVFTDKPNTELSYIVPSIDEMGDNHFLGLILFINENKTMTSNAYADFTDLIVTIDNPDMSYEPFVGVIPSPSPDYPQEIEVANKDLFNLSKASDGYIWNNNGDVLTPGAITKEKTSDFIEVNQNEVVVCNLKVTIPSDGYIWWGYMYYDINKIPITERQSIHNASNKLSLTVPLNAKYLRVSTRFYNDGVLTIRKPLITVKSKTRNLYPNSKDIPVGYYGGGTKDAENTHNGDTSIKTMSAWQGVYFKLNDLIKSNNLKIGDKVTCSIYFKTNFMPTKAMSFSAYRFIEKSANHSIIMPVDEIIVGEWKRLSFSFEINEYSLTSFNARFEANYYDVDDPYYFGNNRENAIWFASPQFELGELTDYQVSNESSITYNLDDNFLADGDYIENGVLNKNIGKLVVQNGTFYDGTNWKGYYMNVPNKIRKQRNYLLCDRAVFDKTNMHIVNTVYENVANVMFVGTVDDTLETLKAKYDGAVLYYELATTEQIQLETTGELKTFEPTTIISNSLDSNMEVEFTKNGSGYEFWDGDVDRGSNDKSSSFSSLLLQKGNLSQEQDVPNGNYSVSFYYQKLNTLANASVVINDKEYSLDSMDVKQFYTGEQDSETSEYITQPIVVTSNHIKIEFKCDVNDGVEIWDLMCNKGTVKLAWSQNQNETTTETVNISKGITITSTNIEAIFKANANGIRILTLQGATVAYFTDKGMSTKELVVETKAQICGTLVQEVGGQTWFTRM